jgi:uncharacterized protein
VSEPDYDGAIAHALARLGAELGPELTYHDLWHTRGEVMPAAVRLATLTGLGPVECRLVEVAAAYHDIGFVESHREHEEIGVHIMRATLPRYGFGEPQLDRIAGMIRATRLPQSPRTLLEEILADADLDILGHEEFFPRNEALRAENAALGRLVLTPVEWVENQIAFLQSHAYFTPAARALREGQKQRHLAQLHQQRGRFPVADGGGP